MSSLDRKGEHWVEDGMIRFTSMIAIGPHLRDYTSNRHIDSTFPLRQSQAVEFYTVCMFSLLVSFMLRTFQGTF